MSLSFTRISWVLLGVKEKENLTNGSVINSINSLGDWGLGLRGEPDSLRFNSVKTSSSSNRKAKRKWKSREDKNRRIDKEYDVILVPSDGACLSGSESDESDWSIGWMEPHAADFMTDDEADDSFAVLVPCYRNYCQVLGEKEEGTSRHLFGAVPNDYSNDDKYMEQWGFPPSRHFEATLNYCVDKEFPAERCLVQVLLVFSFSTTSTISKDTLTYVTSWLGVNDPVIFLGVIIPATLWSMHLSLF